MTVKAASVLAAMLIAYSSAGSAESEADRQACEPEVNRLCSQFMPDRDKIIACLDRNICRLDHACRAVMLKYNPRLSCAPVRRRHYRHHY